MGERHITGYNGWRLTSAKGENLPTHLILAREDGHSNLSFALLVTYCLTDYSAEAWASVYRDPDNPELAAAESERALCASVNSTIFFTSFLWQKRPHGRHSLNLCKPELYLMLFSFILRKRLSSELSVSYPSLLCFEFGQATIWSGLC